MVQLGQSYAFFGASRCGKEYHDCQDGAFKDPVHDRDHLILDGKNLDEMNFWAFREEVALVQREPKLYPGPIRKNIVMGVPNANTSLVSEDDII